MEIKFNLVQLNGEKIADMAVYADAISDILFENLKEEDMFTIDENGFSLYSIPTMHEILLVAQKLVSLGLTINA